MKKSLQQRLTMDRLKMSKFAIGMSRLFQQLDFEASG
jgi:hypothetical protein